MNRNREAWLTTQEAALALGRSEVTLRRWRSEGRGPKYRQLVEGGRVEYSESAIESYKSERAEL